VSANEIELCSQISTQAMVKQNGALCALPFAQMFVEIDP